MNKVLVYSGITIAGLLLTKAAADYMETVRGGPAIGGEFLILPAALVMCKWISDMKGELDMCSVCLHTPCRPGCPNAPDPEPIYTCSECGDGIYSGEKYVVIDGKYYCEFCLDHMWAVTLLELCGFEMKTAEEDGGY